VLRGVHLRRLAKLHEKYGEVVRISPNELSFVNPDAWRDIHGPGSPPKEFDWYGKSVNDVDSILKQKDRTKHARSRKIFTPAFSEQALMEQASLFNKYTKLLIESLKKEGKEGAKCDMVRLYNLTTFGIMREFTFGEPLNMLDSAEYDPWVRIIFPNIKRGVLLGMLYNHYPLIGGVFHALLHRTVAWMKYKHFNYSATQVKRRLKKDRAPAGVDLWNLVLPQEEGSEYGLTREEMYVNAGLFMVAGTETTATLLSGLTYLLLTHCQTMDKLVEEVRSAFASSEDITMGVLAGLPYLNACIKEALRLYPPVPIGLPHLTPSEGSTICGHYVPPKVRHSPPLSIL
jgi:cytochrome P450